MPRLRSNEFEAPEPQYLRRKEIRKTKFRKEKNAQLAKIRQGLQTGGRNRDGQEKA